MGVVSKPNKWTGVEAFNESGFGTGVLILGAIAILVGLLGCATCKCKKACFTIPFVILTLIIGLVLLIIGVVLMGAAGDFIDKAQKRICEVTASSNNALAENYNNAVEIFVCSKACPCPQGEGGATKTLWSNVPVETYTAHKRVKAGETMTSAQSKEGFTDMVWADATTTKTYASWKVCYEGVLKPEMEKEKTNKFSKIKDFIDQGGLDFLESSEQRL